MFFYRSRRKTVKSFLDLRGCSWGYTGDNSLSSNLTIRKLLRSYGENSSFFGNIISKFFFAIFWRATFSDPRLPNLFISMTPPPPTTIVRIYIPFDCPSTFVSALIEILRFPGCAKRIIHSKRDPARELRP